MGFRKYLLFLVLFVCVYISQAQVYIPFRNGKFWGLADTLGRVVVQPVYDEMEEANFQSRTAHRQVQIPAGFFVKKDAKYGYLVGKQVVMQPVHGKLYCIDSLFITDHYAIDDQPVIGSSRDILYNMRGERVFPDSVNDIEFVLHSTDNNLLYSIRAPHQKSALIWYNGASQKIEQTIISNVEWVNYGGWGNKNVLSLFVYRAAHNQPEQADLTFDAGTHKYIVSPPKVLREEPRLVMDDGMGSGYRTIKNKYVVRNFSFKQNNDSITINMLTYRHLEHSQIRQQLNYGLSGATAELRSFPSLYTTKPYNDFEMEKVDSIFEFQNYVILKKGGKYGLICGKTVVKPVYDSIGDGKRLGYNIPFFMVAKRSATDHQLKWGLISANNRVIIPCLYDQFITKQNGYLWVTKKGSRYGIINAATGKVTMPPLYDKITPVNEYSFGYVVEQLGKFGYADEDLVCKPIFYFQVDGLLRFQKYKVFHVKSPDDHLVGYADLKGFAYFKEN